MQSKVALREVVEIAKSNEATTFANQLRKSAQGIQQEQVNFTKKTTENRSSDTSTVACFWCHDDHPNPCQHHCAALGNGATSVESLVILHMHTKEEQELVKDGNSNCILLMMILMKRRLL